MITRLAKGNDSGIEMKWTAEQVRQHNERIDQARDKASGAEPKQTVRDESVAAEAGEAGHADRVHVRVVSFRRRLIDPDNLCPKYFVDCARYAGWIKDDNAKEITLEVRQIKVKTKTDERTEIEIETL